MFIKSISAPSAIAACSRNILLQSFLRPTQLCLDVVKSQIGERRVSMMLLWDSRPSFTANCSVCALQGKLAKLFSPSALVVFLALSHNTA